MQTGHGPVGLPPAGRARHLLFPAGDPGQAAALYAHPVDREGKSQIRDPAIVERAHARLLPRCVADFEDAERTGREGPVSRACSEKPLSPGRRDRSGLPLGTAPLGRASWRLEPSLKRPSGRPSTSSGRPRRGGLVDVVHPFPAQDGWHEGPEEGLPLRRAHLHVDNRDAGCMRRCTMPLPG